MAENFIDPSGQQRHKAASKVVKLTFGKCPYLFGGGGSIPHCLFRKKSGHKNHFMGLVLPMTPAQSEVKKGIILKILYRN